MIFIFVQTQRERTLALFGRREGGREGGRQAVACERGLNYSHKKTLRSGNLGFPVFGWMIQPVSAHLREPGGKLRADFISLAWHFWDALQVRKYSWETTKG